jgi:hypothetical protein
VNIRFLFKSPFKSTLQSSSPESVVLTSGNAKRGELVLEVGGHLLKSRHWYQSALELFRFPATKLVYSGHKRGMQFNLLLFASRKISGQIDKESAKKDDRFQAFRWLPRWFTL